MITSLWCYNLNETTFVSLNLCCCFWCLYKMLLLLLFAACSSSYFTLLPTLLRFGFTYFWFVFIPLLLLSFIVVASFVYILTFTLPIKMFSFFLLFAIISIVIVRNNFSNHRDAIKYISLNKCKEDVSKKGKEKKSQKKHCISNLIFHKLINDNEQMSK